MATAVDTNNNYQINFKDYGKTYSMLRVNKDTGEEIENELVSFK